MSPASPVAATSPRTFWQRRLVDPIRNQLTQGTTPEKLALSLAVATAGGLFPVLGTTTAVCLIAAWLLRLNQPIVHVINQLLWPAQVACILPLIRLGEYLSFAEPQALDIATMSAAFQAAPLAFLADFGGVILRAILGWAVVAPFLIGLVYFSLRPVLQRAVPHAKTGVPPLTPPSTLQP